MATPCRGSPPRVSKGWAGFSEGVKTQGREAHHADRFIEAAECRLQKLPGFGSDGQGHGLLQLKPRNMELGYQYIGDFGINAFSVPYHRPLPTNRGPGDNRAGLGTNREVRTFGTVVPHIIGTR